MNELADSLIQYKAVSKQSLDLIRSSEDWICALKDIDLKTIFKLLKKYKPSSSVDSLIRNQTHFLKYLAITVALPLGLNFIATLYDLTSMNIQEFVVNINELPLKCLFTIESLALNALENYSVEDIRSITSMDASLNMSILGSLYNENLISEGKKDQILDQSRLIPLSWLENGLEIDKLKYELRHCERVIMQRVKQILTHQYPYLFSIDSFEIITKNENFEHDIVSSFEKSRKYQNFCFEQNLVFKTGSHDELELSNNSTLYLSDTLFEKTLAHLLFKLMSDFINEIGPIKREELIAKPLNFSKFQMEKYDIKTAIQLIMVLQRSEYFLELTLNINYAKITNEEEIKRREKFYVDFLYILNTSVLLKIMSRTQHLSEKEMGIVSIVISKYIKSSKRSLLNVLAFQTFPRCYIPFITFFSNTIQINDVANDLLLQPNAEKVKFAIKLLAYCKNPAFDLYLDRLLVPELIYQGHDILQNLVAVPHSDQLSRKLLNASYDSIKAHSSNPLNPILGSALETFIDI
eukprot:NODE_355_length_8917_cov_1.682581.p2 type:complete len:521 gc:universal NODE_355_length_8917_cov_1.682581:931-2493(+)